MSELERLLEIQDLDTAADQLRHRLGHDETRAALAAGRTALSAIEAELAALQDERDTVRREQKRLELDAATFEEKVNKLDASLYSGTITAHKELEALQHEIGTLRSMQSEVEDRVLEQMELAEPLDARLVELARRRGVLEVDSEDKAVAVTIMEAEVGAELDVAVARRTELAAAIDPSLLATYEKIRGGPGGQGAARLAPGGRCEGCHLSLPSAEYAEIKRAPADSVTTCPECGRILVR